MEISRTGLRTDMVVVPEDSWFHFGENKINVTRYAALLGYEELIMPQIGLINAYLDPKYRFIMGCLSRRTGKTIAANVIASIVALFPNTNILIICPNYSLANISWDLQTKYFQKMGIQLTKSNVRDREMVTEHGSMVKLASADRADSAVGRSYDLIIFDEAALHENGKDVFDIALRPTLDKITSKCLFISTPRGENYFKEFYDRGFSDAFPSWISIHSTYADNPRAIASDIEEARRSMSVAKFAQEYEAKFTTFEGQAFLTFDENNVTNHIDYPFYEFVLGVDIGFRDPTACVVLGLWKDEANITQAVCVESWEEVGRSTAVIAAKLRETINKWNAECVYIDAAAAQTKYDLAEIYDISCINAQKAIIEGVSFMNMLIDSNRLVILDECVLLIQALRNITWDTKAEREKLVHNRYIHLIDALRYAAYTHRHEMM